MASEADFSDPVVLEHAVEITFRPTGGCLSFARFGALLSPGQPIRPPNFGPHPPWEVEWLARKLAQQALQRQDKSAPVDEPRRTDAPGPVASADERIHVRLQQDLALAIAHDELSLHYQPICDARTREIVGQEA